MAAQGAAQVVVCLEATVLKVSPCLPVALQKTSAGLPSHQQYLKAAPASCLPFREARAWQIQESKCSPQPQADIHWEAAGAIHPDREASAQGILQADIHREGRRGWWCNRRQPMHIPCAVW